MDTFVEYFKNLIIDPIHVVEWTVLGGIGAVVGEVATTVFTAPFEPFFEEDVYETGTILKEWRDHLGEAFQHLVHWD